MSILRRGVGGIAALIALACHGDGPGPTTPKPTLYKGMLAASLTGDARMPAVAVDTGGNAFVVLADTNGQPAGALLRTKSGHAILVTPDAQGRPAVLVVDSTVFITFAN